MMMEDFDFFLTNHRVFFLSRCDCNRIWKNKDNKTGRKKKKAKRGGEEFQIPNSISKIQKKLEMNIYFSKIKIAERDAKRDI